MTDLSITAGNVKWVSGQQPRQVKGGATITRGQVLRQQTDGEYILADASALTTAGAVAIAVTDGNDGSPMLVAEAGAKINVGATTVAGTAYALSATAGGIAPLGDLLATEAPVLLFWGTGTAEVTLVFAASPVIIPA